MRDWSAIEVMKEAADASANPQQLHQAWEKAYNSGDVDALVELYEPDAMVFPQPGTQ
jgi:ketosteroid isomerase-like protein